MRLPASASPQFQAWNLPRFKVKVDRSKLPIPLPREITAFVGGGLATLGTLGVGMGYLQQRPFVQSTPTVQTDQVVRLNSQPETDHKLTIDVPQKGPSIEPSIEYLQNRQFNIETVQGNLKIKEFNGEAAIILEPERESQDVFGQSSSVLIFDDLLYEQKGQAKEAYNNVFRAVRDARGMADIKVEGYFSNYSVSWKWGSGQRLFIVKSIHLEPNTP
jgi:hypothetical protein